MIVVDASALVAISALEPDWERYLAVLREADEVVISAANYLEAGVILIRQGLFADQSMFDEWLSRLGIAVSDKVSLGPPALAAYLKFGKGFHPARLNLSDCFAYALAKALDAPLLYKGDDFSQTDIVSALQPT